LEPRVKSANPCKFCSGNKGKNKFYCSTKCYRDSGDLSKNTRDGNVGRQHYWKRYFFNFEDRFGHLSRLDQIVVAFKLGQKAGYRAKRKARIIAAIRSPNHISRRSLN
jgi:hypothetical protein